MQATRELMEEHRAIERMLGVLEGVSRKLDVGADVPASDLDAMVEFIQVFADRCHHGKEEDLLFAAMEQAGVPREGGPIGVMLAEHDTGRSYVRGMAEAIPGVRAGQAQARTAFARNARSYVALLSQHIGKEDQILYAIADMHLTPEQDAELMRGFEKVEQERVGPGRHEAFHRLLDRLQAAYAG